jgi:hypothetical protein
MGLVPLLLPFVWVLELDSCGHDVPLEKEITGTMIVGRFEVDAWLVVVPVVLLVILTPFFAAKVPKLGWRVVLHGAGFLATLFAGYGAFFAMFFALFVERVPRASGWVVLSAFIASIIDGLLRLIWSVQEWRRASKSTPG